MKIYEAAKHVLEQFGEPLSVEEIYDLIIKDELFEFGAAEENVINTLRIQVDRKCINSKLATRTKESVFYKDGKLFGLLDWLSKDEINALKDNAIKNDVSTLEEDVEKLQNEVQKIKTECCNKEVIKNIERESKTILDSLKQEYENINFSKEENKNKLDSFISESKDLIQKEHQNINDVLKKAENALQLSEVVGLSQFYKVKESNTKNEMEKYFKYFIFSIIAAVIISILSVMIEYGVFNFKANHTDSLFAIKMTVYLPGIILATFMWRNYTQSKKLYEEYSYKTILASNITIYKDLLKSDTDLTDVSIAERSTLKSLDHILSNPLENSTSKEESFIVEKLVNDLAKIIHSKKD